MISIFNTSVSFKLVLVKITALTVSSCTFFQVSSSMCLDGMIFSFRCSSKCDLCREF
ncbi:hypothetical protein [Inovirus D_HF32_91]|nr:hypothetical protein [Inovirus D_HF32_91]